VRVRSGAAAGTGFAHDGEASADASGEEATVRIVPGGLRVYAPVR
jgi:hypothetical protein